MLTGEVKANMMDVVRGMNKRNQGRGVQERNGVSSLSSSDSRMSVA